MTPKQIEIGSKLLDYIYQNEAAVNADQYKSYLYELFDRFECAVVVDLLFELELIESLDPKNYRVRLTETGFRAQKLGLKKYLWRKNKVESAKEWRIINQWLIYIIMSLINFGLGYLLHVMVTR